ncbi:MAG: serine/threonine protein kinase, partial [Planctomycetes bacterium]|nr:serine/threonine protein kinase [Planctomycetota bacterium]
MTADEDTTARDPVDLLVEQFLQLHRAGGGPSVETFAARHPDHAATLLDLLPTLLALEGMKQDKASSGSGRRRVSMPHLERLGDFRIVREIGRGGMGVVFEAVQESLGRKVALKVLPQAGLLTGNQLERFRREAQIAAQLHHSNIVPVFGSGESDGYHWYAMQFIVGASLDSWRAEQAAAPPQGSGAWRARARFVARVGEQAASALHYAHGLGTLHRDIKPANLLVEHHDQVWVTDFGLAKALEAEGLTQTGDLLGTLQYMAPEQFAGSYDVRSEVYALGVTLYELLVLRPAFRGSTRSELMELIRTQRPEPLRRACPDVPEDLAVVVEKAIARDPADRYADAAALARDLQAFLDDRPIEARRLSAAAMLWRWCRRNRTVALLAASTFVAVLGAGITGWVAAGVAGEARSRAEQAAKAEQDQKTRAEATLAKALVAFGEVFDTLAGKDPVLAFEEDADTGEQTVVARTVVEPRELELLGRMLSFYGQFAAENAGNQALQIETARAWRRVGSIHARLGKPEDLDAAQAAFQQSLERYAAIADRDVRRELAAVHVEFGQLKLRRMRPLEAEQSFHKALELLAALPNAASKSIRAERARVHLAAAASMAPRSSGDGPRGGQMPGRGPGEGRPEFDRERMRRASDQVQSAVALAEALLAEDPESTEFMVLRARTFLTQARKSGRRERRPEADRTSADAERVRQHRAAVDLLRQV